jgi:methylglutaconyl-CoA hydratase
MSKNILIKENAGVVEVLLNRPDLRNAFNPEMIAEITSAFKSFAKRKDIRAVIFSGEGKSFCAGADLQWMQEMVNFSLAKNRKDSEKLHEMFQSIYQCPHPLIAKVQGAAFGGGLGIVACCDFVISEAETQYCFSEVKLGLVPAVISEFVLKKCALGKVGPWMLSGNVFCSSEAKEIGLVHFLATETKSSQVICSELVKQLNSAGPEAFRETKKLLQKVGSLSGAKAKAETTKVIASRRVSTEGQSGLKAFLGKSNPPWKSENLK